MLIVSPWPRAASAAAVLAREPCASEASFCILMSSSDPSTRVPSSSIFLRFSSASSFAAATFASAITSWSICFCFSVSISSSVAGLMPSMRGDTTRLEKKTIFLSSFAWSRRVDLAFAVFTHVMNTFTTLSFTRDMARSVSRRRSAAPLTTDSRCSVEKASMPTCRARVSVSLKMTPQRSRWAAVTVASGMQRRTRRRRSTSMSSSVSAFFSSSASSFCL
mmetsp:Transcript_31756/g.69410  ORF Transcript_31756/g.69410 Transcript_31756/m.69410 type:complete len:220 (+) Transcript_31756:1362-2021(+)